jgi:hypothetical protein
MESDSRQWKEILYFLYSIQISPGAHPASHSMDTGCKEMGIKLITNLHLLLMEILKINVKVKK